MSRRTIISLVASVIMGIGFVGTVSTDASAYYRRGVGVYRGGVYRGGYYRGVRPGVAVGVGAAAVGAAAVGAAAAGAYYAPGYYAPRPVACGYYPYPNDEDRHALRGAQQALRNEAVGLRAWQRGTHLKSLNL